MDDNDVKQQPGYKPPSQWPHLGDYFGSRTAIDIKKARQSREREAILKLMRRDEITEQECKDALYKSDDLAVALAQLRATVAIRAARQQQQGNEA